MIFEYILYALQGDGDNSVVRAVGSPSNVAKIVFLITELQFRLDTIVNYN